jgi:hypothetical protein
LIGKTLQSADIAISPTDRIIDKLTTFLLRAPPAKHRLENGVFRVKMLDVIRENLTRCPGHVHP